MIKDYYYLTKPGIIRGNILTLVAGFMVASESHLSSLWILLFSILGTSLVVASSCVINNIIDVKIDLKMSRTKKRALVTNKIKIKNAYIFAALLGVAGTLILLFLVNALTAFLGLSGMFLYVVVYSYFKRRSTYGTLVGSLSGSIPPVAGYAAVTGLIDIKSLVLFVSLVCWQMAHFYAIAIYRRSEYQKAGIPLLSVVRGVSRTQKSTIAYISLFILSIVWMYLIAIINELSLAILLITGGIWLLKGLQSLRSQDDIKWGRSMFLYSLIAISMWCLILTVNGLIA